MVDDLPHSQYLNILNKFTAKTIFKSLCATYGGNQQVKEEKANLLVQLYEIFKMKEYEYIKTMFSRFKVLVSSFKF